MAKRFTGHFYHQTDPGRVRPTNEDQARVALNADGDVLLIVCDGMGGQNKGEYASKLAIDSILGAFRKAKTGIPFFMKKAVLKKAAKKANSLIYEEASKSPAYKGMGTTLCAALIVKEKILILNVGDSRAYISEGDKLLRASSDQTYVNFLYRTGQISIEATESRSDRHILMNALGIYPSLSMDVTVKKYQGEKVLLCTDGLYNSLNEMEISAITSTDERADQKVVSLIAEANSNGGSDNIGIAFWEADHD